MRRTLVLVCVIVLVDTSFYAAITPLLPYYAARLDLTKASAGVLAAAYPAGTLLASLPTAWLAARIGAQRTLMLGLGLLGAASLVFGFAHDLWLLDTARFAQGIAGAATWTGGLGWLAAISPRDRKAETLGTAFAAAVGGALLGPALGALGRALGTEPTFGGVAVVAAVLLVFTIREHAVAAAGAPAPGAIGGFAAAFREPRITTGAWLIGLTALGFGVLDVLLPLKMGHLGASGAVIAAAFIGAAAIQTAMSRPAGRYVDRRGWQPIARVGLVSAAALLLVASVPNSVTLLLLIGISAGPLVGNLWIPGLALLADGSERVGIDPVYAFGVQNLVWAGAQTIGSGGGGALAHATTDFVPYALVAGVALATALLLRRARVREDVPAAIA